MIGLATVLCVSLGTSDALLNALCEVESGCDSSAVGDDGNAIGAFQIWEGYWKDAIEFDSSIGGVYEDCYDEKYAKKIVRAYMKRYAIKKRLGREVTNEDRARIHNGGPNGWKRKSTLGYWENVKEKL